jgi:signal transduction histidine kinase
MKPEHAPSYEELRVGFTAAVSHELRTPLARLLALLDGASLPEADTELLLDQARAEVRGLSELVDDILFLAELERDADVARSGATRVALVAAEVFSTYRERAELAGVELRADVDPDFELPLRRRLVRVIVANLAENAIRYAGSGAIFVLTAAARPDSLELVGADDGAGVGRSDLPRLFERFFRTDRARGSAGTGLGLAIVKHVVAAAGGTVDALPGRRGGLLVRCRFPRK